MKQLGYVRRKMVKCTTMVQVAFRNDQFEYIKKITGEFIFSGLPVLSIDTKKKEWQNKKEYQTSKTASMEFLKKYPVKFNMFLPQWNYALNA